MALTDEDIETLNLDDDDYSNSSLRLKQFFRVNGRFDLVCLAEPFNNRDGINGSIMDLNVKHYSPSMEVADRINLDYINYSKLFSKGSSIDVSMTSITNSISVYNGSSMVDRYVVDITKINSFYVTFIGLDGVSKTVRLTDYEVKNLGQSYYFKFSYDNLPFDVMTLQVVLYYNMSAYDGYEDIYSSSSTYTFDREGGFANTILNINETPYSKTEGLLGSIIQWLTSIRDNIVNLPSVIINGVKGFFDNVVKAITDMLNALKEKLQFVLDGITNALTALGNFVINGIKGLFIPSQETIVDIREDWEMLLAKRFGALYEVCQLVIDYANSFNSAASVSVASGSSSITFPVVTVPLGSVNFEFGGWEVDVVPSGFEFLINSIKMIVSVSATILFVNGLRNKFERLVTR